MKRLLTTYIRTVIISGLLLLSPLIMKSQTTQVTLLDNYSYSDTFKAHIYIDSFTTLGSVTLDFFFDTTYLDFSALSIDSSFNDALYNIVDDRILFAWLDIAPVTQADTFATITFLKKKNFCNTSLNWGSIVKITDEVGATLNTSYNNGKVFHLTTETPLQLYPPANSSNIPVNSVFNWQGYDLSCVKDYGFQIATDTNFTQLLVDTIVTDTFIAVSNLPKLSTNYWRVAKIDEWGNYYWTDFSTAATKDIDTTLAIIPEVVSWEDTLEVPITFINNEPISSFNLQLTYDSSALTLLNYSNVLDSNTLIFNSTAGVVNLLWQTPTPFILPSDTLINLKFSKKTACVTDINWSSSSVFYFTDSTQQAAQFNNGNIIFVDSTTTNLLLPLDSSQQVFIRPELAWNSVFCTNGYQLQVSPDSNFNNLVINNYLFDTTFTPNNLLGDSTYFWRVGRYNAIDSLYWSAIWQFTTEPVLPVAAIAYDVATLNDTLVIPIQLDSIQNTIAFQLQLDYDTSSIKYLGFSDTTTLISGLKIQNNNNGFVTISWESEDSTLLSAAAIPSDTLLQLHFEYLGGCQTTIDWNTDSSDFYHINSTINIDAAFQNSTLTFLKNKKTVLDFPLDGATTARYPDLSWQTVECATEYRLLVAMDSLFTQIQLDTSITDTTFWVNTLAPNTKYFWRVDRKDLLGDYLWSDTLSFVTASDYSSNFYLDSILTYQDTATLTLTVDSLLYLNGLQLSLNYNSSEMTFVGISDTLLSKIQAQDNAGLITLTWSDTTWYDIIQDTLLKLHFKYNGTCISTVTWSTITLNYRNNAALAIPTNIKDGDIEFLNTNIPTLITPFNNQIDITPTVDFSWQSVDCSEEYQLQIAENSDFSTLVLDSLTTNLAINDITLKYSTTYYWRIGRWDSQDDVYWSDTATFTTADLIPITLSAGDTLTYADTLTIPISLDTLVDIQAFTLQLDYDSLAMNFLSFSDTLFDMVVLENNGSITITWTSTDPSDLLTLSQDTLIWLHFTPNQDCYADIFWNINNTSITHKDTTTAITLNTFDGSLHWINNNPPELTFPANDTLFLPYSFQLEWQEVLCAESYQVQLSFEEDFNTIELEIPDISINSLAVFGLTPNQKYYWRVGQEDELGEVHWSAIWNFRIDRSDNNAFRVYPNPTTGLVNIWFNDFNTNAATITIYNSSGQLLQETIVNEVGKQVKVDFSPFRRGLYILTFNDGANSWTEKVVVF